MAEDLHALRIQLRYYLRVCGRSITADDRVCCPNPEHADTAYGAALIEDEGDGDRIMCPVCGVSWQIFDVEGFFSETGTDNASFRQRVAAVKEKLLTVLPVATPGIDKPLEQMTDAELAARKLAQAQAQEATAKAKAAAKSLAGSERKKRQEAENEAIARVCPFRILGRADDGAFYFESYQGHIECMRLGAGITKEQLFLLADMAWWENEFHGGRSRIDMDSAKFYLIAESNRVAFNTGRLRGRGCWRED
jgi:hypothetical protein